MVTANVLGVTMGWKMTIILAIIIMLSSSSLWVVSFTLDRNTKIMTKKVSPSHSGLEMTKRQRQEWNARSPLFLTDDSLTRRDWLSSIMIASTTILYPMASQAKGTNDDDDPLAAFGKSLSTSPFTGTTSGYPYSPSPLPTNTKSAEDFATMYGTTPKKDNNNPPNTNSNTNNNDLNSFLKQKSQQRNIDPRTHG